MDRASFFLVCKRIATLGRIGYLPASGTCATLVTLPFVILLKTFVSAQTEFALLFLATIASLVVVEYALQLFPHQTYSSQGYAHHDPSQIVIDEVIGCLWAFYGISLSATNILVGFLLFRTFDILKPLGIHQLQKLPRAWGVMGDDLLAGIYTALLLYVFS